MRRFAFGREVPSLRGDRGKLAYTGQNVMEKQKALLPSFLSGRQNPNDDKRKEYNMTLSEESGIG